jgi:hypothetical protein
MATGSRRREERRERDRVVVWVPLPHGCNVIKTAGVKNERFRELDGRKFPVLRFDGQNQTQARAGWPKIDFFLVIINVTNIYPI